MPRQINGSPGFRTGQHASGIGTVGNNHMTVSEPDIGEEPFIPPDEGPLDKRRPFQMAGCFYAADGFG